MDEENKTPAEENKTVVREIQTDKSGALIKEIFSWIKTIAAALIFAFIINKLIIVNAQVPTGSMKNTIMPGDRLIANRLSYLFGEPQRFDIAVFKYPDDESLLFVKRVIGLPGETVEIKEGKVFIDGSWVALDDSFVREEPYGNYGPYQVPEGCYFMLGDNRMESKDSKNWNDKYVKKEKVLGKAVFRYWEEPGYVENQPSRGFIGGKPSFKWLSYEGLPDDSASEAGIE